MIDIILGKQVSLLTDLRGVHDFAVSERIEVILDMGRNRFLRGCPCPIEWIWSSDLLSNLNK
jgi:hypothetical protein